MNTKNILLPHACQKIGWWLLAGSVCGFLVEWLFFARDFDVQCLLVRPLYFTFIVSIFLVSLSKEKVEDEMIAAFRLKAVGITAYAFFVFLLILNIVFVEQPGPGTNPYLSELFLIALPVLLFVLYYGLFRWMLCKSRK
ncbi:hypothetical protein SAMN06298214_1365 [Bacteroidales bacterium WCE2004]|nr:hypothetical protein SAMN06298214_1365 [Bacteroidales bacterium WCE2004]